ncbi:AraC family transcriptional regulator [Oceanispirochaeta crateris]|uniref:AraC family transcriptional regulator n=2 Tax=Oceanispirochaeta crateris TaxID=2518645 RepID=A0A5C1QM09_9SPIO|nr:AraC family transcriptional regulator [Oceanispirochaeta crateris]
MMTREQFEYPLSERPRLSHFGFSENVTTYNFAPHYHYGYELIFVTKGEAKIELFKGRNPIHLKEDDLCIISPKTTHDFIFNKQFISFYWMGFQTGSEVALSKEHMQPPTMLLQKKKPHDVEYFTIFDREIDEITENFSIEDYAIFEKRPYFNQSFSDIYDELHIRDQYSGKIIYQKILEIFTRIARLFSEEKSFDKLPLHYFKTYLDSHCMEKIDFHDLSEKTGYTQEHISRLFKSTYGRSPKKYHDEKRLNKACVLLSRGASVDETAGHCGFSSASYFSIWFKKLTGISPQKY